MNLQSFLKKNKKTHLIFDFDETLVKLILPWEIWHSKINEKLNNLDKKILKDYLSGKIDLSTLQNLYIQKFGKDAKELIIKNAHDFESSTLKGNFPNPELIDFIKNNNLHKMFVWSSNTRITVHKILDQHQIKNRFKKIITRQDVDLLKPYIEGFNLIHDQKIPLKNYLFIGNSEPDRIAAKAAGIDFYHISYF